MAVLLIKSNAFMPKDTLMKYHDEFVKQLETGVVVIPAYFDAEILNIPSGVDVIVESDPAVGPEFMSKKFNIPKLLHYESPSELLKDWED